MSNDLKDCYELMEEANAVMEQMKEYDNGIDFDFWLYGIRDAIQDTVSYIKAGKSLPADFLGQWNFLVSDSLDHMLEERLAGHAYKANNTPDFKKWSKGDVALYKLFDELTAIVKNLVETCKPEHESRIAANRAATGLPNIAARNAVKAEAAAAARAAAQAEKNARAAERAAAAAARVAENKAAANAKKAAMTNEERVAAANRAAKATATRKARLNAERAAGEALLAANNGRRPKRNVSRKKGNNNNA